MKKIICPKCDHPVVFDDSDYPIGQAVVFECEGCRKSFTIRVGEDNIEEVEEDLGHLVVIENCFGFKQTLHLKMGDNIIGRYNKGTEITLPIETKDRSMDRRHCIVNVKRDAFGELTYTIRDNRSVVGTFVMNRILGDRERMLIEDGAIITLGATTLILHTPEKE
ncbi:MAG: FHA domain-containing protein [Bacteroidaceae bacterium]|nr:FHA domain-containing protein [Bacteroidaceae bacterium]MBQ4038092.1 FHA domain-containing protein [Bacteroidaceae bacterium]